MAISAPEGGGSTPGERAGEGEGQGQSPEELSTQAWEGQEEGLAQGPAREVSRGRGKARLPQGHAAGSWGGPGSTQAGAPTLWTTSSGSFPQWVLALSNFTGEREDFHY